MATTGTRPWDAADHLKTEKDIVAYVDAAFEDGDPALVAAVLGDVARAKGTTRGAAAALRALRARFGGATVEEILALRDEGRR